VEVIDNTGRVYPIITYAPEADNDENEQRGEPTSWVSFQLAKYRKTRAVVAAGLIGLGLWYGTPAVASYAFGKAASVFGDSETSVESGKEDKSPVMSDADYIEKFADRNFDERFKRESKKEMSDKEYIAKYADKEFDELFWKKSEKKKPMTDEDYIKRYSVKR